MTDSLLETRPLRAAGGSGTLALESAQAQLRSAVEHLGYPAGLHQLLATRAAS